MPKVSIIVPVYNAEAYLNKCIDSLLAQTLRDIEIIAVDDGSSDNSPAILQAYAKRDKRINVISCVNGGVSRARNTGIHAATGDYIGFVDADDWVDREMYQGMYDASTRNNLDVCICDFLWEYPNRKPSPANLGLTSDVILPRSVVEETLVKGTLYFATFGSVWKALIRREMLMRENIFFPETLDIMEDGMFNMHMYFHAQNVMYIKRHYYHYRQLKSGNLSMKYRSNLLELMQVVTDIVMTFFKEHNLTFEEFQHQYELGVCFMGCYCLMNICNRYNTDSVRDKVLDIRMLLEHEDLRNAIERIQYNETYMRAYQSAKPMQRATYSFIKSLLERRKVLSLFLVFSTFGRFYELII